MSERAKREAQALRLRARHTRIVSRVVVASVRVCVDVCRRGDLYYCILLLITCLLIACAAISTTTPSATLPMAPLQASRRCQPCT
jgi:hypothetical protein